MQTVGESQKVTEKTVEDKFADTKDLAHNKAAQSQTLTPTTGRISPQISCTVSQEDRQLLNELTLYCSNREGRLLNTSSIIRALIHLGHARKEEMEF